MPDMKHQTHDLQARYVPITIYSFHSIL